MMMRRKLIKQGGGGFTVYLPKKWIDNQQLTKASSVNIDVVDGRLLVSPETDLPLMEAEFTLTRETETGVRTMITNAYRAGYDRITVHFEKESQLTVLQAAVKSDLIGFEIVKQQENICSIENITEPSADQFETLVRKILYNISELFGLAGEHLEGAMPSTDFKEVEVRIKKYDNFCRRVLAKQKIFKKRTEFLWTFLHMLIHAQREIYHLLRKTERGNHEQTRDFLLGIKNVFDMLHKGYVDRNLALLEQIHVQYKDLYYDRGCEMMRHVKGEEAMITHYLLSSLRQFYLASSPLIGYLM